MCIRRWPLPRTSRQWELRSSIVLPQISKSNLSIYCYKNHGISYLNAFYFSTLFFKVVTPILLLKRPPPPRFAYTIPHHTTLVERESPKCLIATDNPPHATHHNHHPSQPRPLLTTPSVLPSIKIFLIDKSIKEIHAVVNKPVHATSKEPICISEQTKGLCEETGVYIRATSHRTAPQTQKIVKEVDQLQNEREKCIMITTSQKKEDREKKRKAYRSTIRIDWDNPAISSDIGKENSITSLEQRTVVAGNVPNSPRADLCYWKVVGGVVTDSWLLVSWWPAGGLLPAS